MRNTLLILFIGVFQAHASDSYSQNTKLTLNMENVTVAKVLEEIESNSEFFFLYNAKLVDVKREVTISIKDEKISDILASLFSDTGVNYIVYDRKIILSPGDLSGLSTAETQLQKAITGTVTDKNGAPLPGVNVVVTETTQGTMTDVAGKYSIEVPQGSKSLTFSFIGMQTQEITISTLTQINVTMAESATSLDEVVVIGYGTMKKSDLTGAVSSVSEKDFSKGVSTSVDKIIQGKSAGVNIMQANSQPGGATRIQIRGITSLNASNEPLYVVDGMPIDNSILNTPTNDLTKNGVFSPPPPNPLNTINPSDIASVEILKDASATAIYGSRGANGVVLITTKSGQNGKMKVTYAGSIGIQEIAKEYDLPNAYEYSKAYNSYYDFYKSINPTDPIFNNSVVHKFSDSEIAAFQNGGGTDWFNALTRQGFMTNHQLSMSGGTDNSTYYASVGFLDHKGVISLSDLERLTGRINVTQKIAKILEFGINLSTSTSKTDDVPIGTNDVGDSRGGATSGALFWAPTIPGYASDGTINVHPYNSTNANPYGLKLTTNNDEQNRIITTSYLQANFTKNFLAKITVGYDKAIDNSRSFVPAEAKNSLATHGMALQGNYANTTNLLNFILQYKADFKKHHVEITGGTDYQTFKYESLLAKSSGFATSSFSYNNMYAATTQNTFTGKNTSTIFSYLGRINYSFNDKYFLTGSFREDGSSKFAEGHKWGFFPSGALAWKLGNENFIKNLNLFSDLKLRISYGKTGNQSIGNNNSQPLLGSTQVGTIGNAIVYPIGPTSPGNKALTWETTTQQDGGLDFGILSNRITGSIDYYKTVTTNLLLSFQMPSTSGFSSIVRNAGAIQNNGIEFSLNSQNLSGKLLQWSTSFNIAYNKNKWKDRAGLPYAPEEEHGPVNGIYGYIVDGIWQQGDDIANSSQKLSHPGQFKFRDVNHRENNMVVAGPDNVLNTDDRVLLGNQFPTTTMGLTNALTYKNLTLTIFMKGMFGFKIYNQAEASFENPYNLLLLQGVNKTGTNFWTPNNTNTMVPSGLPNSYGTNVNSNYVENGDFVRLQNINLSYQLPFHGSWFQSATVYVNIDNVFLITKYSGLDPESANPVYTKSGSENDVYPNARTFTFGFNFNF